MSEEAVFRKTVEILKMWLPLTISNQNQGALCFASSISDLAGKCPLILLGEMVHDELNDACRDVMTHLVGLQKNTVVKCA